MTTTHIIHEQLVRTDPSVRAIIRYRATDDRSPWYYTKTASLIGDAQDDAYRLAKQGWIAQVIIVTDDYRVEGSQ